jgi:hypothetical protein
MNEIYCVVTGIRVSVYNYILKYNYWLTAVYAVNIPIVVLSNDLWKKERNTNEHLSCCWKSKDDQH